MKCPCKECICVPVCRHKGFLNLVHSCSPFCVFTLDCSNAYTDKVIYRKKVEKALNSTMWFVDEDGYISDRKGNQ